MANETVSEANKTSGAAKLRITWIKSDIGHKYDQRATIRSLGFRRLNEVIERADSPSLRGMISKVKHLVKLEIV